MKNKALTWEHNGISWEIKYTYIDTQTGQILLKKDAHDKTKYIKIKTLKRETIYNRNRSAATINVLVECRRQPQTRLNLDRI